MMFRSFARCLLLTIGLGLLIMLMTGSFAFAQFTGAVSGTVWNDVNGNGVRDGSDAGIPNWTVILYGPAQLNGVGSVNPATIIEPPPGPSQTDLTDGNGDFRFSDLANGGYVLLQQGQDGWVQTYPTGQITGFQEGYAIVIAEGGQVTGRDFGKMRVQQQVQQTLPTTGGDGATRENGHLPSPPLWALLTIGLILTAAGTGLLLPRKARA